MPAKESQIVVKVASSEELAKALKDFAKKGRMGIVRNGDQYIVYRLSRARYKLTKIAEIVPVLGEEDGEKYQSLLEQLRIRFGASPRIPDQFQLNPHYQLTEQ